MARDLEGGFFDRLALAPVRPAASVLGPMLGAVVRAFLPLVVVLAAGFAIGARLPGGALGLVTLAVAAAGSALIGAGWGIGVALRVGSTQRAAPLMFLGIFLSTFLSTGQVPLGVMTGWLHAAARVNPVTAILRLARAGFVGPVTGAEVWPGLLAIAVTAALLGLFALRGLRRVTP